VAAQPGAPVHVYGELLVRYRRDANTGSLAANPSYVYVEGSGSGGGRAGASGSIAQVATALRCPSGWNVGTLLFLVDCLSALGRMELVTDTWLTGETFAEEQLFFRRRP
jgi:hypothetical protein